MKALLRNRPLGQVIVPAIAFVLSLAACAEIPDFGSSSSGPAVTTSVGQESGATPRRSALFAFAPLSGAPPATAEKLADAIGKQSKLRNLQLAAWGNPSANYTIKGYLSAVPDGDQTTLVYVWDVLAPDRSRLHRITGQIQSQSSGNDPWQDVEAATLDQIAAQTVVALIDWVNAT